MWFKKEKHCKMHDDLQELQYLTNCLKNAEIELAKLGKEIPIIEPYSKYDGNNPWELSNNKVEHFSTELTQCFEWLLRYGTSNGYYDPFNIIKFLPKEKSKYLKDLGNYLLQINDYYKKIENKKQEIKDLKNQIEKKKKKLDII